MKSSSFKTLFYALFFGILSGITVTVALSVFIPQFFTDWAGSFVCPGRVGFVIFKQSFYCYTSPTSSFDLGDAMFWAIFKRFLFPDIAAGLLFALGFGKAAEFLWQRRAAAGF